MTDRFFCGDLLTSRQNSRVKEFDALKEKKYRDRRGLFRLDGRKLYTEALLNRVEIVETFVRASTAEEVEAFVVAHLPKELAAAGAPGTVHLVSDEVFEKISEEKAPEGILCAAKYIDKFHKIITINNIPENSSDGAADLRQALEPFRGHCLLLEAVQDPGNLGTMIRSAAAFGASAIVLSSDCADIYHPRTIRGAMGALFRLPIVRLGCREAAPAVTVLREQGRRVFAAELNREAAALGDFPLRAGDCAVIGNEGHGLGAATIAACDRSLFIPMTEGSESLNAAIAASVFLWELARASH